MKDFEVNLNQPRDFLDVYLELINYASSFEQATKLISIKERQLFERTLALFGPKIDARSHQIPLEELYDVAIHISTHAILVGSKATTIPVKTSVFGQTMNIQFQSFAVYMPVLGVEVVHVGQVGDILHRPFVLRSESACTTSFVFGSQHCNCASQWRCTQELAAYFNHSSQSATETIGFLMVHLESQNGMGMGFSKGDFAFDLGNRAHLRHAAGLALAQQKHLSIKDTFAAMGLPPDPRLAANGAGYKMTPIILDFLNAYREPILLSNNPQKINGLKTLGYHPQRLKALGEITQKGLQEADQRFKDFNHMDIGSEVNSFAAEFERLKIQIQQTYQTRRTYVN